MNIRHSERRFIYENVDKLVVNSISHHSNNTSDAFMMGHIQKDVLFLA